MALTLDSSITPTGMNQGDLYKLLSNIVDIVNELQTDAGTLTAAVDGIVAKLDADITTGGATDTDYEAIHGLGGSGAALPAALTNSTALTLG